MYDTAFIEELKELIGFGVAIDLPTAVSVDAKHITGTTGRTFGYFHRFVSLDNLYQTARKIGMDSAEFNAYLDQMKEDAVKGVLAQLRELCGNSTYIYHYRYHNIRYDYHKVLSDAMEDYPQLLANAIGYFLATTAIEEMIATSRINSDERNVVYKYDKLKIELEGLLHENGNIISEGLKAKKRRAIKGLTNLLCGSDLYIEDATHYW